VGNVEVMRRGRMEQFFELQTGIFFSMEKKSDPFCQKFQEESYDYVSQLISYQQDSIKGMNRLNRDISSMVFNR
jgi:hypothetical protein